VIARHRTSEYPGAGVVSRDLFVRPVALALAYCTNLCYRVDLGVGWFGAREAPVLFVLWGGIVPAALSSVAYGWLLYSDRGCRLMSALRMQIRRTA